MMKMLRELNLKPMPLIFSWLLLLITMLPKISTLLIVVLTVFWIFEGNWKERISFYRRNYIVLLLPIFFLLHLISLTYTDALDIGWRKIETSLSLLIIPLLLPTFKKLDFRENADQFKNAFILGILINMIFCVSRSIIRYSYELYAIEKGIELESYHHINHFFYSYISYFMHYGYMAMYVNIAIVILLQRIIDGQLSKKAKRGSLLLVILFSLYVLMLYSKAGILAMLVLFIYFIAYQIFKTKNIKSAGISLGFLLIISFILFNYVPYTKERVQGMIDGITNTALDPDSHESTQLRVHVWKASMELMEESWLWGYGFGDANNKLLEKYQEKGYRAAYEEDLNAHNQFFQTELNVGVLGVFVLLLFFIMLYVKGVRKASFQLQAFAILSFLVFLFESYLQTQKGIYYFVILCCLLLTEVQMTKKIEE